LVKIRPPPIKMSHISSGPIFHRDSESEVRTFKFQQWDMIWLYLAKIRPLPIMMIYISSGLVFHRDSESEIRTLKFHQWDMIWLYLDFSHIWQKLDLHQS
jgi:phenylalanyl-tRNA synthetase alpha subunit